jgi:transposase
VLPAKIRDRHSAFSLAQNPDDLGLGKSALLHSNPLVDVTEKILLPNPLQKRGDYPRGERLRIGVPHGHWKTTTFIDALTIRGFIAPLVFDGPINRDAFETYVEQVLVRELSPEHPVNMDNLSSQRGPKVRELIEAAGARLLYLPPHSPDFNPIENAFAKLKPLLRKAANRTVEGLWSSIGELLTAFKPAECRNYFAAAGYDAD